jgi:hypothetical protein
MRDERQVPPPIQRDLTTLRRPELPPSGPGAIVRQGRRGSPQTMRRHSFGVVTTSTVTRGSVLRRSLPRHPAAPSTSFPSPPVGWAAARASGIDCIARLVAAPSAPLRSAALSARQAPVRSGLQGPFLVRKLTASQLPFRPSRGRQPVPSRAVAPRLVRAWGCLRRASSAHSPADRSSALAAVGRRRTGFARAVSAATRQRSTPTGYGRAGRRKAQGHRPGVYARFSEEKCRKCKVHPAVHSDVSRAAPRLDLVEVAPHASPAAAAPWPAAGRPASLSTFNRGLAPRGNRRPSTR